MDKNYLCSCIESNTGLVLTDDQLALLSRYYELVIARNQVMNLTAITEEKDFARKHFVDSLSLALLWKDKLLNNNSSNVNSSDFSASFPDIMPDKPLKVIDIGTGAGFPGMVLKIAFPAWEVTLFDSLQKRVSFLEEVIADLGLTGITAVHGRAEDFGKDKNYREQYSLCVSRAVANISTLSEYCLPFVSVGGGFFAYKSGDYEEELEQGRKGIEVLGGKLELVKKLEIIEGNDTVDSRALICIKKADTTPTKYPRKAGIPAKRPL